MMNHCDQQFYGEGGNLAIQDWLDSLIYGNLCWWCGQAYRYSFNRREIHHIAFRSHVNRPEVHHPCNLLLTHVQCHRQYLQKVDKAIVLSRKLLYDADHFDLKFWLQLEDKELRAPGRITLREIVKHLMVRN